MDKSFQKEFPTFIGLGMSKSATTFLHEILISIPGIHLPESKELNFLASPQKYKAEFCDANIEIIKEQYFNLITNSLSEKSNFVAGELSTTYLPRPEITTKIIKKVCPNTKFLIICFREPVSRFISLCSHLMYYHGVNFSDIKDKYNQNYLDFKSSCFIHKNLKYFLKNLPPNEQRQYLLIDFKDITQDPEESIRELVSTLTNRNFKEDFSVKRNSKKTGLPKNKLIGIFHEKIAKIVRYSNYSNTIHGNKSLKAFNNFIYNLNTRRINDKEKNKLKELFKDELILIKRDFNKFLELLDNDFYRENYLYKSSS